MIKMYDGFSHNNFAANPLNSKKSLFKKYISIRWKNSSFKGSNISLWGQYEFKE